jgi:SAM-dependent methyltransferase
MLAAVSGTGDHVLRNRAAWDRRADEYAGPGVRNWSAAEPSWGIWGITEAEAGVLPAGLEGKDGLELGCGTGYVSAWLARRGARPAGLDNSAAQLATARQLQGRLVNSVLLMLTAPDTDDQPAAERLVEDLLDLRPGPDAITRYPFVTLEWARQWPSEEVWKARKIR